MSKCLNPKCLYENPKRSRFCQSCGSKLLLGDRYRATKLIGQGGFGRTFLGIDEHRLDTQCAIKQLLLLHSNDPLLEKAIELFQQEARQLCNLGKHPQIPDLLAYLEHQGQLYIVQDFIEGDNLLKELKTQGKFSREKIGQILDELLPVLQFIHEKNVIHRDIKPDNIMRTISSNSWTGSKRELVLIDFGISKQLSATLLTGGTITGTPGYAPPEQMRGMVYPASDLYSLAVTCLRLLTGCFIKSDGSDPLFNGKTMEWVWREKLRKDGINIGTELEAIFQKMLAEKASDRFESAAEVVKALKQPNTLKLPSKKAKVTTKINYQNLTQLLGIKKWREADLETNRLMLEVTNRQQQGWMDAEAIANFPCPVLRAIDKLWVEFSGGYFGFSIQNQIYHSVGQSNIKFAEMVGWKRGKHWLSYEESLRYYSVRGHFPCFVFYEVTGIGFWFGAGIRTKGGFSFLATKLAECGIA